MNYEFLIAFSAFLVIATLLPLLKHDAWWIRVFEFPRLQISALILTALLTVIYTLGMSAITSVVIATFLMACLLYQISKIVPYTLIYKKQMLDFKANDGDVDCIRLMISNVFMENKNVNGLVEIIHKHDPDLLLVLEVNLEWHDKLTQKINFNNVVSRPLENTYGMTLYSKFDFTEYSVENLVEEDVPSIHAKVCLPSGKNIDMHCLHPKPPAPQETSDTTERDAELLLVGKRVKQHGGASIVAGDLNDVAWSYTTTLFQKVSNLLDPRIGRGMYNSFHAKFPFLRFPLDHAFASKHFKLINIERLESFGSDHFPILVELAYTEEVSISHEVPIADKDDKQKADEKIKDAMH